MAAAAAAHGLEKKRELRWEEMQMERKRLDAFARVVALSLHCHKVDLLWGI